MEDWQLLEQQEVPWLVNGLLPADSYSAIVGKPKAGKSTVIRNLVASVIKSRPFLDRQVNIPEGIGRVLYIHLDRKDRPWRVVSELKKLGITDPDEQSRLRLMVAEDIPPDMHDRLTWLKTEVAEFRPHLLVIDLALQFLDVQNTNDYKQVLVGMNSLQDALSEVKFNGAVVAAFHARKATTQDDPADDVLGSTAIRGSFSNLIHVTQNRLENRYMIMSDQTDRDDQWGEIELTELIRNDDGTMSLGRSIFDIRKEGKEKTQEDGIRRLLLYLQSNSGVTADEIVDSLGMSKPTVLRLFECVRELTSVSGIGVKGDPKRYSLRPLNVKPVDQTESIPGPFEREEGQIDATIN